MHTTYSNDFGLLCDNKSIMPYLQRFVTHQLYLSKPDFGGRTWSQQSQVGVHSALIKVVLTQFLKYFAVWICFWSVNMGSFSR